MYNTVGLGTEICMLILPKYKVTQLFVSNLI